MRAMRLKSRRRIGMKVFGLVYSETVERAGASVSDARKITAILALPRVKRPLRIFFRAFFQPFDLKKWFLIGIAAWLSNLGSGSYNFRFHRGADWQNVPGFQAVSDAINQIPH